MSTATAQKTLTTMSFDDAWREIEKATDSYLLVCKSTRNKLRIEDARNAVHALVNEYAQGKPTQKQSMMDRMHQHIADNA